MQLKLSKGNIYILIGYVTSLLLVVSLYLPWVHIAVSRDYVINVYGGDLARRYFMVYLVLAPVLIVSILPMFRDKPNSKSVYVLIPLVSAVIPGLVYLYILNIAGDLGNLTVVPLPADAVLSGFGIGLNILPASSAAFAVSSILAAVFYKPPIAERKIKEAERKVEEKMEEKRAVTAVPRVKALNRERKLVLRKLERLERMKKSGEIDKKTYKKLKAKYEARLARIEEELKKISI
mgnify:CR=1 FL=1